jgi:hypothetical protein
MAYLKLNSAKLKRTRAPGNDFVIFSQVIGSQSSYEIPKKVTDLDSLNKWFGTDYSDYSYHSELLGKGATLFLYKPVSLEKKKDTESYLDYSGFGVYDENIYADASEIPVPADRLIYRILDYGTKDSIRELVLIDGHLVPKSEALDQSLYVLDDLLYPEESDIIPETIDRRHLLHRVLSETTGNIDYFVWVDEVSEYINVNLLPQNIGVADRSTTWNNRDTLVLTGPVLKEDPEGTYVYPSHPRFSDTDVPEEILEIDQERLGIIQSNSLRYDIENSRHYVYALDLDFSGVSEWGRDCYLCFYVGHDQTRKMIYFDQSGLVPNADFVREGPTYRYLVNPSGKTHDQVVQEIWEILVSQKDTLESRQDKAVLHRIGTKTLWSEYPIPNDCFFKLPGLRVTWNERIHYDLVAQAAPEWRLKITPRTIGRHQDPVSVKIERLRTPGWWQMTVDRGGYGTEIHTGTLFHIDGDGHDCLEYVVNRDSELIRLRINPFHDGVRWKPLESKGIITDLAQSYPEIRYCPATQQYYQDGCPIPNPDLPEGTWYLRGAVLETWGPQEYQRALDAMAESDIKEDFLMIPRITDFRSEPDLTDLSWYPEYELIYGYCKEVNCQAVISNRDIGEEVEAESPEAFMRSIREPRTNWTYKVVMPGIQYSEPVCVNPDHQTDIGVRYLATEYALSESKETAPGKRWKTSVHDREPQQYVWTKTSVTYYDNTTDRTEPKVLIPSDTVEAEYRLSESSSELTPGDAWSPDTPEWRPGTYLWVRHKIIWSDPKATLYYRWTGASWTQVIIGREFCNPWLNEFIWNYIKCTDSLENPKDLDPDNRLVYFYREITGPTGETRPAYYAFLEGILTDTHNFDRSDLMYESPVSDPLYLTDSETALDVALESKKSNFLVSDGYGYYYRKYFNHTGDGQFNTSILCRFFQSKLSRDLDRRKWDMIGALTTSKALEVIQGVLDSFTASFKLVAYAVLDDYTVDRQSGSIDLWITMRSKELVDKDINLNITLNYTN